MKQHLKGKGKNRKCMDDVSGTKTYGGNKKKERRQQGSKTWTDDEVKVFLDIVEDILPAGSDAWNLVALEAVDAFNGKDKSWC